MQDTCYPKAAARDGGAGDIPSGTGHRHASLFCRLHSKQNLLQRPRRRLPDRLGDEAGNAQGSSCPADPPHRRCLLTPPVSTAGVTILNQVITVSSPSSLICFNPITTVLPPNLGKLATCLAAISAQIGFFPGCTKARGPPELQQLNLDSHRDMVLLNYESQHGLPISLPQGMS